MFFAQAIGVLWISVGLVAIPHVSPNLKITDV